jgi:hypothetical protein
MRFWHKDTTGGAPTCYRLAIDSCYWCWSNGVFSVECDPKPDDILVNQDCIDDGTNIVWKGDSCTTPCTQKAIREADPFDADTSRNFNIDKQKCNGLIREK